MEKIKSRMNNCSEFEVTCVDGNIIRLCLYKRSDALGGFIPHRAAGNEIMFASLLDTTVIRLKLGVSRQ